jgi:small subunit ribosomal protein S8
VCQKLAETNYLANCQQEENKKNITAKIKYSRGKSHIHEIKKISKPSQHIHVRVKEIKKYCPRKGTYVISTPLGLLTQREAVEKNQGGKIIFFIS